MQGNTRLAPGTAIATFDAAGRYANGHAAIYMGQSATGLYVIDQWNDRDAKTGAISKQITPHERLIHFETKGHTPVNIGENYYVIH